MRSLQLDLSQYDTDKIESRYLEHYDKFFAPWFDKKFNLLELGVKKGGSLELWRDYFPAATVTGIDINVPKDFTPSERINVFEGSQADTHFLTEVATKVAPAGFDIIIDDASHVGNLTKTAFWHLFDHHLVPGGCYVIEDWGTGYWDRWIDGKSLDLDRYAPLTPNQHSFIVKLMRRIGFKFPMRGHNFGMVGFVKQLVDEQGALDVTKFSRQRRSKFENMVISHGLVVITKAQENK
ncbi:MAG: class I SAM-dependent methyltransferase [Desulfuromonadaceae bacterium]|nr:class I SAM-dependent methyltransferase [Desulfuromonadaceae bacterium]